MVGYINNDKNEAKINALFAVYKRKQIMHCP